MLSEISLTLKSCIKKGLTPERIDVMTICELVDERNYPIRDFFYGKQEVDVTYIGSLISDYIIDYFTQRDIVVLSVFDEFIIEEQHEEELVRVMKNAYAFVCDNETNCKIVKEK